MIEFHPFLKLKQSNFCSGGLFDESIIFQQNGPTCAVQEPFTVGKCRKTTVFVWGFRKHPQAAGSACEAKMTRYLKGWKRILDKDNTNRCNWYEFQVRDPSPWLTGNHQFLLCVQLENFPPKPQHVYPPLVSPSVVQDACRVLGFRGNIGGAWRAFDEDLSGPGCLLDLEPKHGGNPQAMTGRYPGFMDAHLQTCYNRIIRGLI